MAKITLQRFNDAPVEYNQRSFSEIIRQLEQLIQALNSLSLDDYIDKKEIDTDNQWKCDKCNTFNCPYQKTIFWDFK